MIPSPPPGPRLLGPLLAELRAARGWSQQRMAAELCAASGVPTLTRNEVSRWERQLRLPGDFWSAWLAAVLGVPGELLAEAAARSRRLGVVPAAVGPAGSRARLALLTLAYRWAGDPGGRTPAGPFAAAPPPLPGRPGRDDGRRPRRHGPRTPVADEPGPLGVHVPRGPDEPAGDGSGRGHPADRVTLATLRRWDDLLGGGDLAGHGARRLRRAVRGYRRAGPAGRR
ncbi:helix-turn-helix domain-containing protein, partial [Micromonospora sp. CPCC 205554]